MQVNYTQCREIEAQITEHLMQGYQGFSTLKLYQLKDWWSEKMKQYHRQYCKIGNKGIYTNTAEGMLYNLIENILKYGTYGIIGMFVLLEYTTMEIGVESIVLSGGLYGAIKSVFTLIPQYAITKVARNRMMYWFEPNNQQIQQQKEMKQTSLSLHNIGHAYEGKTIFNGLNCSFNVNDIYLIKGENGTGKSTLFKIMTGLLKGKEGFVKIGEVPIDEMSEAEYVKQVFYLPQQDARFTFTARALYEMCIVKKYDQAIEIAIQLGLTKEMIELTPIYTMSGGESKKVFLALALALNPPILLLDEPTNSLDDQSKKILCQLLKEREYGALIITHDEALKGLTEHVYVIEDGVIRYGKTG